MRECLIILSLAAFGCAVPREPAPSKPQAPVGDSQALEQSWQFGPVRVTRQISHRSPLVSDVVHVRFEVTAPSGVDVKLSDAGEVPENVTIARRRQTGPTAGSTEAGVWTTDFDFEVLLPGVYELAALEVSYRNSPDAEWTVAKTGPASVEFRSLLGDDPDAAAPKANPGPVAMPRGPVDWRQVAAALVVACAAVVGVLRWRHRRRPEPMISAHRKALDAIDALERAGWLERQEFDRFYTELSGAVRRYVEDRFGLRAPEQTTEEFLDALVQRPVLATDYWLALARFLEQADLVKFARARPTVAEGESALRAARDFVYATRDDSVLVEATGSAG